jgi:hypothetical protein
MDFASIPSVFSRFDHPKSFMSSKKRDLTLLVAISLLAVAIPARAQGPLGNRANGMGGAFVGVADDATAVYWNPAGLATGALVSGVLEAGRDNSSGLDRDASTHQILAFSLPPVGFAYYRHRNLAVDTAEPVATGGPSREEVRRGVFELDTSTVAVALLHSVTENVVISAAPKVIWGGDSTRVDLDAAVMVAVNRFRVGLIGRHLTSPSFEPGEPTSAGRLELEPHVRVGGAWGSGWPGITRLVVAVDADVTERATLDGDRRDVAAGVETWWLNQRLGVRGGVRGSTTGEARPVVSGGLSAAVKPGFFIEGQMSRGESEERSWGVGARFGF